jgi:hypothetical protein
VDVSFDTSNDNALQNLCYQFSNENGAGDGAVPITGTAAGTSTLSLDTNASDCQTSAAIRATGKQPIHRLRPLNNTAKNNDRNPVPLTVAFAGLLLAGFLGRSSRKLRGLAGLIVLAAAGLAASACGSNVNTNIPNPPHGTYTITVSGQDSVTSTITATTTFTFVIN